MRTARVLCSTHGWPRTLRSSLRPFLWQWIVFPGWLYARLETPAKDFQSCGHFFSTCFNQQLLFNCSTMVWVANAKLYKTHKGAAHTMPAAPRCVRPAGGDPGLNYSFLGPRRLAPPPRLSPALPRQWAWLQNGALLISTLCTDEDSSVQPVSTMSTFPCVIVWWISPLNNIKSQLNPRRPQITKLWFKDGVLQT